MNYFIFNYLFDRKSTTADDSSSTDDGALDFTAPPRTGAWKMQEDLGLNPAP